MIFFLYMLATVGLIYLFFELIIPIITGLFYGYSYSLFLFGMRDKCYFRKHPLKSLYFYMLKKPIREFLDYLFGTASATSSITIKGKEWIPPHRRSFFNKTEE